MNKFFIFILMLYCKSIVESSEMDLETDEIISDSASENDQEEDNLTTGKLKCFMP